MGKILEVKCNGLSSNQEGGHSVLYPNFVEFRDDKDEANTYEECVEIEKMNLSLK